MGSRFRLLFSIALGLCMPVALAQTATTTSSVTLRAGPDRSMPSVTSLLSNTSVNVVGCLANWSWCDVIAGRERGWVYTRYLSMPFEGSALTIASGGPRLGLLYPREVFSLSHLALPFPLTDSLYGMLPDSTDEDFGVNLGALATRGERGLLIVSLDSLTRMSSNPFFSYMMERIEEGIGSGAKAGAPK